MFIQVTLCTHSVVLILLQHRRLHPVASLFLPVSEWLYFFLSSDRSTFQNHCRYTRSARVTMANTTPRLPSSTPRFQASILFAFFPTTKCPLLTPFLSSPVPPIARPQQTPPPAPPTSSTFMDGTDGAKRVCNDETLPCPMQCLGCECPARSVYFHVLTYSLPVRSPVDGCSSPGRFLSVP